ncbi:hypothetical protein D3C73_708090 [compost metagenome]
MQQANRPNLLVHRLKTSLMSVYPRQHCPTFPCTHPLLPKGPCISRIPFQDLSGYLPKTNSSLASFSGAPAVSISSDPSPGSSTNTHRPWRLPPERVVQYLPGSNLTIPSLSNVKGLAKNVAQNSQFLFELFFGEFLISRKEW